MTQVDLETIVTACAGGGKDRKIACETLAGGGGGDEVPPDFPPESFWLSKDAEYDWFDRNAFFERKDSTKGNNNSSNLNPHLNPNPNPNSQRFSVNLKSKASIIGLPKSQKATFADCKRRSCKPANLSLFPKRSDSMVEPGSPKVSCMGRVKSKRCRRRSNSLRRSGKPVEKLRTGVEKEKTGLYSRVMSMFRSKKCPKKPTRSGSRKVVEDPVRRIPVSTEPVVEPPGLGGMKRFISGRRSGSWTTEDFNQGEFDRRVGGFDRS
ncbi:hypothetical protein ACJIZ3_021789 [Penstemon smallii]|uniref:Uncharacterized protein n=1 Tax=Penstemon smallii TaxID=265156 RepID=A0ABD3SN15_9LAMI